MRALIGVALLGLSHSAGAWQSANVQYLSGDGYQLGRHSRHLVTVEGAAGNAWGDVFAFVDYTQVLDADRSYYGEVTGRLSGARVLGIGTDGALLSDVLLAVNVEKPEHRPERWLMGVAADFRVPGFRFFKSHLFWRNNQQLPGHSYQLTLAWNAPFVLAAQQFLTEGFVDLATREGREHANQLVVPRLLWNVGSVLARTGDHLWLGVEWSYWNNKFGLAGVTESVPQLQIKWVF